MANGNGGGHIGKWAIGTLTTLAFLLGGFAVGGVAQLRERSAVHEQLPAHSNVDARLRATELALAGGRRFYAADGAQVLRLIELLARECPSKETRELVLTDADRIRADLLSRPYFSPVPAAR